MQSILQEAGNYTATSGCRGSTQQTYHSQNLSEQPASQHEATFLLHSFPLISRRKVCFHSRETKLLCRCLRVDKLLVCSATLETASVLQQAISKKRRLLLGAPTSLLFNFLCLPLLSNLNLYLPSSKEGTLVSELSTKQPICC